MPERKPSPVGEHLSTVLDTLSDGVYVTDITGEICYINAPGAELLGWSAEELVGSNAHQILHHHKPDGSEFPGHLCPLIQVWKQGVHLQGEDHFIHKDGRFIPVAYKSNPLYQDGVMTGAVVSYQDISALRKHQDRLRLQQAALDSASAMVLITDCDGIIQYANPAFSQQTGFSLDEVLGQHTRIFKSGIQDKSFYQAMWTTLMAGKSWEGEMTNKRKDGSLYLEDLTITPINQNGEITHFVAIKRDISEQSATRTRLRLLEKAIQESEQGIFITSAEAYESEFEFIYANSGFERITGLPAAAVVGSRRKLLAGCWQDDKEQSEMALAQLRRAESVRLEVPCVRPDGEQYVAEVHMSPMHDEKGRLSHFVGLLSDVSSRKEFENVLKLAKEHALEASRLKSEFLSSMSHEIRTPMNGIIGMADLLMDTALSETQHEFVQIMRDSAHALLAIINDILDLSKIEAGKLDIEIARFSLPVVVEGVVDLLASRALEKGLGFRSFVDPAMGHWAYGDATRIRQVLMNLVGNAIKFTEQGAVEIKVFSASEPALTRFEIRDTGVGLTDEAISRLFNAFTQADSSTTRKYGGTGLGLAISKRLVELMGGRIGVTSQPSMGSTFWFELPLTSEESRAATGGYARTGLPRVLVVADSFADMEQLHQYLDSWRVEHHCVRSRVQALEAIEGAVVRRHPYSQVLVDLQQDESEGLALCQTIRKKPQLSGLNLVMLTTRLAEKDRLGFLDAGFDACLSKPLRQSRLFDLISDTTAERQPPVEPQSPKSSLLGNGSSEAGGSHLLLVEDNVVNQKVAQLLLGKLGYQVHCVDNGQDAVQAVAERTYAAILMDCQMPVMDGFQATAAIRAQERQRGGKPSTIIAMTANAMQGDRALCLQAGMDDYLSKPIDAGVLSATLKRWIEKGDEGQQQTQAQLLDSEHLLDLFDGDIELLAELLNAFGQATTRSLSGLDQAIASGDMAGLKSCAHDIRGSASNLGIMPISQLALELEQCALESQKEQAGRMAVEIRALFDQAMREADALLGSKP